MALSYLPPLSDLHWKTSSSNCSFYSNLYNARKCCPVFLPSRRNLFQFQSINSAHQLYIQETLTLDKSSLDIAEAVSEEELKAAASLRVRSFYEFRDSHGIEDHKRYVAEHEFEALKELIAGKRLGFRRVSCINATLPLSQISCVSEDLCSKCKFSENGEDQVVVGTLDLNQCLRLPNEITGKKPEGTRADTARAYLSNVCVAKELHRNGVGYALVAKSKKVAQEWGITDLYVHVAIDNEPAKLLYLKSGFIHESNESAWEARFSHRPRRILLWTKLPITNNL